MSGQQASMLYRLQRKSRRIIKKSHFFLTGKTRVHSFLMQLDAKESIQRTMAAGVYEPEQSQWMRECLVPGDRFVDVGANFGWYTALASQIVGVSGEVFSFEPSPVASTVIGRTIAQNHIQNVTLIKGAVGDSPGEIQLYMPVNDSVHSPSAFASDPAFIPLNVPVYVLDAYAPLTDNKPIKLIKIDVEGYEPNVIKGMQQLIKRGMVKNIFCEFNSGWLKRNKTTAAHLQEQITSLGYKTHKVTALSTGADRMGGSFDCQDMWFKWEG